ncbi:MAG: type II toxin-antitoxin system RelE/ParE family toxin [Pseudolabrys sp.]|jgi:mRNA interferase RelE/StbE
MQVVFTPAALRQWVKIGPTTRASIKKKIDAFAATGTGNVKRLQGRAGFRLRAGDWRVIFYMESQTMIVVAVGNRRDIYD